MNQVLLGAAIPFALAMLVYGIRRARIGAVFLVLTPFSMLLGAFWAVIPDLPRLLGRHDLYFRWSNDPRMNLFFWHYSIDQIEPDSSWYAVGLLLMAASLLWIGWREIGRREAR